ncbi:MAG TPA: glycerol-3-phosphate 1-O-acyltransferase PlsY [Burkholderiales bacterium]|nr:glycerol-3-phosphate 1-O-acyltransferase PlsY [Burkholderiales bacterium]
MKVLFAVASYLVGSIPTGYLVVRAADRRDIRDLGSGATGATNVLRVKGLKFALPVMIVDVLKGFLPVFLALRLFHDPFLAGLCSFLAVLGHCLPFSIGFRGGKGVATSVGAFGALGFPPVLASLAVFAATAAVSRFVSLGSILAALLFPLFVRLFHGPAVVFWWSLPTVALVVFKHKDNIRRLFRGEERRLGEKKP